ncbi:MAG: oligopeptide transport system substrate-binding protein [Flavobacteriales bacterium]|jgi:oligopeptide transport system substrate-binding protein
MRKLIACLLLLTIFATGCADEIVEESNENVRKSNNDKIVYGGTLDVSKEETFSTMFPTEVLDLPSYQLVNQLHDGLVEYDPSDFSLRSAVAREWEMSEDGSVYTFHLRKDVYFHNDACFAGGKGRNVTANDVKFSIELLASKEFENSYDALLKPYLKGVDEYYSGSSSSISGLEVIGDYTIKFTLKSPSNSFIYMLAMPNTSIIAKEAFDKYGKEMTIGCGPFKYVEPKDLTKELYLTFNERYYQKDEEGNSLPYVDSIHFSFIASKQKQLEAFNADELDIIDGLTSDKIAQVVAEKLHDFSNTPPKTVLDKSSDLSTQYYSFTCTKPPFDNVLVRQAFNYAVDRDRIILEILDGRGTPGFYGITPKTQNFAKYNFESIKGYDYNPEKAKELMAQAGYPDGEGFPEVTLEINLGGSVHKLVSSEIERQLSKNLGVNISIDQVSFKNKLEHSKYGTSEMYRSAWVADYPLPESFLSILFGGDVPNSMEKASYPNVMRYVNPVYDSLFLAGKETIDMDKSWELFAQAENVMMQDAPIIVLWYDENYSMYHSSLRNYRGNGLKIADYARAYIKPMTADEIKISE